MLNTITLMGRLTRDPELRRTQSGTAVASFTLAVERDIANKETGDRQTDFIDIIAWRGTAEFASKYFAKGQMAAVSGRLQMRDWTDKDGGKRRSAEVIAESIYFADSKKSADGSKPVPAGNAKQAASSTGSNGGSSGFTELDDDEGELPF